MQRPEYKFGLQLPRAQQKGHNQAIYNPAMGTERKKAALLHCMEPQTSVPNPRAPLRTCHPDHRHLPPPWDLPWLLEGQTLESHRLSSCLCHLRCWPLPGLSFRQQKGTVEYMRATEAGFLHRAGAPDQWPSTHKASSCTAHQRTQCSATAPCLSKHPSIGEAICSFGAAMKGQRTERGISRSSLPYL